MILAECKRFLLWVRAHWICKWMQVHQQFGVDIVPPVCNFIKSETPAQVFSWKFCGFFSACNFIKKEALVQVFSYEFWEIFYPPTLLKTSLRYRCFPTNFAKFLRTLILQNICEGLLLYMIYDHHQILLKDLLFIKKEN